jgi:hypothetical protein
MPAAGRTPEATSAARATDAASHKELNALRALPENDECFDCTARKPGWAALPHGIYLCLDCAQVHRHLGRHISQVKTINTGTYLWFPYEMALMRTIGNARAAWAYRGAPPKLEAGAPASAKQERAQALYGDRRWGAPQYEQEAQPPYVAPAPPLAPSQAPIQAVGVAKAASKPKMARAVLAKSCDAGFGDLISFEASPEGATADAPKYSVMSPLRTAGGAPWAEQPNEQSQPQRCAEGLSPARREYNSKKAAVLATFTAPQQAACELPAKQIQSLTQPPAPAADFFKQFGL